METAPQKYAGQYIAWVNDNIIASGKTQLEVFRVAKKLYPDKEIIVEYAPTKKELVTFL
ncbi:MAG TPA: DUF5678 domain-containing protein [Candidatus Nanoarchaeia archaeon]|nr:DUF5678 domain-containing protein [Candidatus Nanoarchaeia archaeon]